MGEVVSAVVGARTCCVVVCDQHGRCRRSDFFLCCSLRSGWHMGEVVGAVVVDVIVAGDATYNYLLYVICTVCNSVVFYICAATSI